MEHFEKFGRPLKLAIDISIWNFQTQSGKGGQNPVLRTLYYRLLRLLSLAIRPLFVFDGPHKPPFKRNKKTGPHTASLPDYLTKQLLKQFGFPFHIAPGEAEAECALLQRNGIVDAVLSEDVDTLMFGCGVTIRNWSSEGTKGNKSPTHVNLYQVDDTTRKSGLDSSGMVLVALMSGGDYVPEGIPGCGVKTACEAARGGFGKDLCELSNDDLSGWKEWREWLQHELHTNESGYFRQKHKTLMIPTDFPRMDILRYYTHPTVSTSEKLDRLRHNTDWNKAIDVQALRAFAAEAFDWVNRSGAVKFIRGLAPALLVQKLQDRTTDDDNCTETEDVERAENALVTAICGRRKHFITDGLSELRVAYVPSDMCGLDLDLEETDDFTTQASSESEADNIAEDGQPELSKTASKKNGSRYDPGQPEKLWVLETYVKVGAPLLVETWEEDQRNPRKFATRKARERKQIAKGGMKPGALNAYVKLTKPGVPHQPPNQPSTTSIDISKDKAILCSTKAISTSEVLKGTSNISNTAKPKSQASMPSSAGLHATQSRKVLAESRTLLTQSTLTDSWTPSRRPSDTLNAKLPRGTRYSALGIYSSGSVDDTILSDLQVYDENSYCNANVQPEPPASPSPKPKTPSSKLPADCNVTVRRKRKAKSLTKAFTAPCGHSEIVDLDTSDEERSLGTVKRSAEQPGLDEETVAISASSLNVGAAERVSVHTQDRSAEDECPNPRHVSDALQTSSPSTSPASSLPSPSELKTAWLGVPLDLQAAAARNPPSPKSSRKARNAREQIMLRDSLEGAWRNLEPVEKARSSARVFSSVEIVDLTSD